MVLFDVYIDESGNDGKFSHVLVGGVVATMWQWKVFESGWSRLMGQHGVKMFHYKKFKKGRGVYRTWSTEERANFLMSIEKLIRDSAFFEFVIAVERSSHRKMKRKWSHVEERKDDTDGGFAFRLSQYLICQAIASHEPNARVRFFVENGNFTEDMRTIYGNILSLAKKAKGRDLYAHMLQDFNALRKKEHCGTEAADFVVGRKKDDLEESVRKFLTGADKKCVYFVPDVEFFDIHLHNILNWYETKKGPWALTAQLSN